MPKSYLQEYPGQLRLPDIRPLPDGRFQLADYRQFPAPKWDTPAYGSLHPFDGDIPTDEQTRWGGMRLISIDPGTVPGKPSVPALIYLYEQIAATGETQVGKLTIVTDENGREVVEAQFIQFSSVPYVKGTIGTSTPPGASGSVLTSETAVDEGILRKITRRYVQATASEVQVGRDTITTDANDRQTLTRQFIQLSSATYVPGTIGSTVTVGGRTFALSQEEKQENATTRTIVRRWVEATAVEVQVGRDTVTRDENSRRVVERTFVQLSSAAYVPGTIGSTITVETVTHALTAESKQENAAVRTISRRWIEATAVEVQVGRDEFTADANNRRTLRRTFIQLSSAAYSQGIIGSTVTAATIDFALSAVSKVEDQAVRRITRDYLEATASEVQVGGDQTSIDDNNRRVLQRQFIQLSSAAYVPGTIGAAITVDTVAYALDQEQKQENVAVRSITRRWVEVTDALVQVGASTKTTDANGRVVTEARFVIRAAASYAAGVVGITTAPGDANSVMDQEQEQATVAVRLVVRRYVQATGSFVQVGPDILDRELNGLLRVRRRSIAVAGTSLPAPRVVGTTTGPSSTILAGTSTEGSSSAVTLFTETYLQPGIVEAEVRFDDDLGVLYVTFRSVGTKFTPTALNPPATLTDDPLVAFQGGSAGSVIRDRIQNVNGYRTFIVTVMLASNGSALTPGTETETRSYQDYIEYPRPGTITFSSSEGFKEFPGERRSVLVTVKEYISTNASMPAANAWRPFAVKSWANTSISFKPVGQNFSTVVSKGAQGYLASLTTTLTGGNYVGVPIQVGVATASSDPTPAAFAALDSPILSAKNVGSFTADNGTVWYRKRLVTLVGTFGAALDY